MVASPRFKWFGLALLATVQFMVVLDIAIVNVALPSIQTDLDFSQANLRLADSFRPRFWSQCCGWPQPQCIQMASARQ